MQKLTLLSAIIAMSVLPLMAQETVQGDEQELALRADPWTHLVVTLTNGKKVTFARGEIAKVQYVTQHTSAPSAQGSSWMGRVWHMRETAPDGRYCDGTWTRQGNTNRFSGHWVCSWGARVSDTLVVRPIQDRKFVVFREGLRQNYYGTLSADGRSITGTNWSPGGVWKAKIE